MTVERNNLKQNTILQVADLQVEFRTQYGVLTAVNDVTFQVSAGETLAIVGESGSGKSATQLAILGLLPTPPGRVVRGRAMFGGEDLLTLSERRLQDIRGRQIGMVFQDPMTALNPFLTIGTQLAEMPRRHFGSSSHDSREQALAMLERVGIVPAVKRFDDYPHQFSGGMRQRVLVAMALICRPQLVIADEPTTALDVSIQAQILDLIQELAVREGTAVVMITHNLGVVASRCQRVVVMYAGRIVEMASVQELFSNPRHPYTRALLASIPRVDAVKSRLVAIEGQPPDLVSLPPGCAFAPRCTHRIARCSEEVPQLNLSEGGTEVACWVDPGTIDSENVRHET
ncbi:MAG: ABC transporter ATP-binding protein [Planctomycetota bacterium]|nr:ABC transporter ATP-binding protein [Planctomycetota bacterium]MDA1177560.1 ABC transporter ATP-binding protein [Planctomycetota bacterium]